MSNQYLGEIRAFAGNFAPRGWAFCYGQLLPINGNEALYSLLGTFYGGNGINNFGVPDLRGRTPIHQGQGPGLTDRYIGERTGWESVPLQTSQLPPHNHSFNATAKPSTESTPINTVYADNADTVTGYVSDLTANTVTNSELIADTGHGDPHYNMMPYQTINYIISLTGNYPPRS